MQPFECTVLSRPIAFPGTRLIYMRIYGEIYPPLEMTLSEAEELASDPGLPYAISSCSSPSAISIRDDVSQKVVSISEHQNTAIYCTNINVADVGI